MDHYLSVKMKAGICVTILVSLLIVMTLRLPHLGYVYLINLGKNDNTAVHKLLSFLLHFVCFHQFHSYECFQMEGLCHTEMI